jgi:DNA-binding transcriptional MerR regulator
MDDTWRVEELAERAAVSVELIRSYQSKGLLPAPRHQGRVAYYGRNHLERLKAIRDLKARGHSLRAVASMLNEPSQSRRGLAPLSQGVLDREEKLSLIELADRARVPPAMLRSLEASGVLRPVKGAGGEPIYTTSDVRAVRYLLSLVGSGVPMEEFMSVARVQLEAADAVVEGAVELFMRYVREPLNESGLPQKQEAERLVAAFRMLVQAASGLIAYNFERAMLNAVQDAIATNGTRAERAAIRREVSRRTDVA